MYYQSRCFAYNLKINFSFENQQMHIETQDLEEVESLCLKSVNKDRLGVKEFYVIRGVTEK